MEKGVAKGHIEDARRMKAKNYSVDDIVEITGLSRKEIEEL